MQPVAIAEPTQTSSLLPSAPAGAASTSPATAAKEPRTALGKLRDVLKVLLRAFNEIRRLLRDSAAEIGEILGGELGREVGRIAASCLLGLLSEALLAEDQLGQPSSGLELNA